MNSSQNHASAPASAKPTTTTGAIFGATPGMPAMFKSNFDYQLVICGRIWIPPDCNGFDRLWLGHNC